MVNGLLAIRVLQRNPQNSDKDCEGTLQQSLLQISARPLTRLCNEAV